MTSITKSCLYLKSESSLQWIACSPNWSRHALRHTRQTSLIENNKIMRRYQRIMRYSTRDICCHNAWMTIYIFTLSKHQNVDLFMENVKQSPRDNDYAYQNRKFILKYMHSTHCKCKKLFFHYLIFLLFTFLVCLIIAPVALFSMTIYLYSKQRNGNLHQPQKTTW
jgi:hypothetical protein